VNRVSRIARILLMCLLLLMLAAPAAIAEEAAEGEVDPNDFTGTYAIGGQTGTGKSFSAVITIWDGGTQAAVRGVIPKVGPITRVFKVQQLSESEYQVTGGANLIVISGSGAATITKVGEGYEIAGSASGQAFGSEGSVTFGGARSSTSTTEENSTTVDDGTKEAASGEKPMNAVDSAAQPLTPDSQGELAPVDDQTRATLVGVISILIAVQLIMEVLMGGKVSMGDIKDGFAAAQEVMTDITSSEAGSSMPDATKSTGDVGKSVDNTSAGKGGDE
jgi:hypothetical protein